MSPKKVSASKGMTKLDKKPKSSLKTPVKMTMIALLGESFDPCFYNYK